MNHNPNAVFFIFWATINKVMFSSFRVPLFSHLISWSANIRILYDLATFRTQCSAHGLFKVLTFHDSNLIPWHILWFLNQTFFTPDRRLAHRDNPQLRGPDPPSQPRPGGWLLQYLMRGIGWWGRHFLNANFSYI